MTYAAEDFGYLTDAQARGLCEGCFGLAGGFAALANRLRV